jgi:hypothetical protein
MLSAIPIIPLESFYFVRFGETNSVGIPFLVQTHTTEIEGIPLAHVDKLSVVMAYARGIFAAMVVVGFIGAMFTVIPWLTGEQLDERKLTIAKAAGACLAIGIIAGTGTYLFPFQMSRREKIIRRMCGTVLGIAADPARVRTDHAEAIGRFVDDCAANPEYPEPVLELIRTRVRIALGEPKLALEDLTDDLLERIRTQDLMPV